MKRHVDLLRTKGRAILTRDIANPEAKRGEALFKLMGYVDVYGIEDVACDENGLRFKFVKRYRRKILGR